MTEGNFFNICVLSQCILYWINFQNIYTLTYQNELLRTFFCLFLKSLKAFSLPTSLVFALVSRYGLHYKDEMKFIKTNQAVAIIAWWTDQGWGISITTMMSWSFYGNRGFEKIGGSLNWFIANSHHRGFSVAYKEPRSWFWYHGSFKFR